MKRKGFTLVELLAVIIVIAIISLIIFPVVTKQIAKSKQDLYNVQVENIIKAAKDMVLDNPDLLDENHVIPTLISIEEMQSATNKEGVSYLEDGTIKSPLDQSEMHGTVVITYDEASKGYIYEYKEKTKSELSSLIVTRAAKTIIAKNNIHTNEAESGLFEDVTNNEYIFKGENPNNFIKIGTSLWRVISIDKDTYTMKVAKTTHNVKSLWANSSSEVNLSFSNTALKIYTYLNSDFYNTLSDSLKSLVVENSTWNIGSVSGNIKEVKTLKQTEEKSETFHANVGLLTVSDYANATYTLSCRKDFTQSACAITNYLVLDKEYFLLNPVSNAKMLWTISPNVGNALNKASSTVQLNVVPVINLKAKSEISGGEGTVENPYILSLPSES